MTSNVLPTSYVAFIMKLAHLTVRVER